MIKPSQSKGFPNAASSVLPGLWTKCYRTVTRQKTGKVI